MALLLSIWPCYPQFDQFAEAKLEKALLGKWKSTNHPSKWEFFKDGSVTGGHELAPQTGNYRIVDKTHIRIKWPDYQFVYEVTNISTNALSLKTPAGVVWAFKKI